MKYSPLVIHCASLCLDVISRPEFYGYKLVDIQSYQSEVYELLKERTEMQPLDFSRDHKFLSALSVCIISILIYYRESRAFHDTEQIMSRIQTCIDEQVCSLG